MDNKVYSVSELNGRIKNLIDSDPALDGVYIRGELSNYKIYPSGHHYFTMKDAEGTLRCVMFKGSAVKLRFRPENGMQVIAFGRVTVYPRDGAYQLYCSSITPDGVGDLYVAFEQLKEKLSKEGLFSPEHKKPLPRYPERIALITSGAGAAVRDMIRVLGKRFPLAKVIVMPVRVQGVEAPPEIVGAIKYANRHKVADLIITGRGGGSIEDLWAFNDERVARVIYESEIPIISAVGHEPDVTIADYVADVRAATPSNGAELAVQDKIKLTELLAAAESRCRGAVIRKLEGSRERLGKLAANRELCSPMTYVNDRRQRLDHDMDRLASTAGNITARNRNKFTALAAGLDAMSPLKVLARGYSVARKDGAVIKSAKSVKAGDSVSIRLADGSMDCTVTEVNEHDR
ncbi:MAG: exodeoxyribonuclease VII large subunit [Clostridiales bacterium]|nr:exodeoxyribonuclease VII large subunit [Clostridiales bacterium]